MRGGADAGRLDPEAVDAVLAAAGRRVRQRPRELPAALTERELEVLLVLVRGESSQAIAEDLGISRPRPSGITSSTSNKRPASAAGPRRRSVPFEHDVVRTDIADRS